MNIYSWENFWVLKKASNSKIKEKMNDKVKEELKAKKMSSKVMEEDRLKNYLMK